MDYGFRVGIAGSVRPGTDVALTFEMSLRRLLGCSCVNQLRHKLLEAPSTPFSIKIITFHHRVQHILSCRDENAVQ